MKLLTAELRKKIPAFGKTANEDDPMVWCKFFTRDSHWTWYVIEFDGEDIFYGYVEGFEKEFGTFSLSELEEVRGMLGLPVERDLYFTPCRLSKILDKAI